MQGLKSRRNEMEHAFNSKLTPENYSLEFLARRALLDWYRKKGLKGAALTEKVNRVMVVQFGSGCKSLEKD
jgi:hypothetical protein